MKLSEVFPSSYLKSDDLQGREVPVVIASAKLESLNSGESKLVLTFQGKKKSMICNKTNAGRIAFLYGDDTDGWVGKEIVLNAEMVEFQGRTVMGLRVKPPAVRRTVTPVGNGKQHVVEDHGRYAVSTTQAVPDNPLGALEEGDQIPF